MSLPQKTRRRSARLNRPRSSPAEVYRDRLRLEMPRISQVSSTVYSSSELTIGLFISLLLLKFYYLCVVIGLW